MEDDVYNIRREWLEDDFNPRPPCGGRLGGVTVWQSEIDISIHVPRVEDDFLIRSTVKPKRISIHVPRVEDDAIDKAILYGTGTFQSTSPVWRTTTETLGTTVKVLDFNPRPPCGGRPRKQAHNFCLRHFNPRPPCGGRRLVCLPSNTR